MHICIYLYIYIRTPGLLGSVTAPAAARVGLYKIFVLFEAFYQNQYYYSQTLPLFGHPTPSLHRIHYCAIQCFPSTILYYSACHTILVVAISCKGQPQPQLGAGSAFTAADPPAAPLLATELLRRSPYTAANRSLIIIPGFLSLRVE